MIPGNDPEFALPYTAQRVQVGKSTRSIHSSAWWQKGCIRAGFCLLGSDRFGELLWRAALARWYVAVLGVEHSLCCRKPARRRLDQMIRGKSQGPASVARRRDGQWGLRPWCCGRHPRRFSERHRRASVVGHQGRHPVHPHLCGHHATST
jgi:hypothetical protein